VVFIAGNTASDPTGNVVGLADVKAQTRYILEKIKTGVEATGGSLQDIVCMNVFSTDARGSVPRCGGKSILRYPGQKYFFHNCLITNVVESAKGLTIPLKRPLTGMLA
jgi:hypothetical protein